MYLHQKLIAENALSVDELPEELRLMFQDFEENQYELQENDSLENGELKALQKMLVKLDKALYHEIKELLDQESSMDLDGTELKESILDEFYRKGTSHVSPTVLKRAGYPLKNAARINERAGQYRLVKRRYDAQATIIADS